MILPMTTTRTTAANTLSGCQLKNNMKYGWRTLTLACEKNRCLISRTTVPQVMSHLTPGSTWLKILSEPPERRHFPIRCPALVSFWICIGGSFVVCLPFAAVRHSVCKPWQIVSGHPASHTLYYHFTFPNSGFVSNYILSITLVRNGRKFNAFCSST